jgi:hypothetical protein
MMMVTVPREINDKVDELVREFLAKASDRGVSTEFLCDSQRVKFEDKLRFAFKKLLSISKDNPG